MTTDTLDATDADNDSSEVPLEQALALGIRAHQNGNLDTAQAIYQQILDVVPDAADALHFLGIARHQAGDSAAGVEFINRSIELDPQANRYNNLGNVLLEMEQFEGATDAFRHALDLDPTHADAYNNLGALLKAQKRFDEASVAYEKALAINPEHVDAYNNMGNLMAAQGRVVEAVNYFCKAITLMPTHKEARKLLGIAYYTLGETDKAADVYRQWLADEPDNPIPRHHLAACTSEAVPLRAADAYVERTFDAFASSFDARLGHLDYCAPQLLAEILRRECGAADKQLVILDAGCGTGLCGPLIADYAAWLVGVDLSAGMLEKARPRQVYDQLVKAELTAYLQSQTNAFDVILSADTLVYFGALEEVLAAARGTLRANGYLFFSVESIAALSTESEVDYRINPHGRYSHGERYLRQALTGAGFLQIVIEPVVLRREAGKSVHGFTVSCRSRPSPSVPFPLWERDRG